MVLIETLSHFILASNPTSKPQANYKQTYKQTTSKPTSKPTSKLQAKHDIYGNHEQASTNSTKQRR